MAQASGPTRQASAALRVRDVAASRSYYVERLGFAAGPDVPGRDVAFVIDTDGDVLLLVGPAAGDVGDLLAPGHWAVKAGDRLLLRSEDLDALRTALSARGLAPADPVETAWGDRTLELVDPDGYHLSWLATAERSAAERIALYLRGPDALEAAVASAADGQLDHTPPDGGWTVRQAAHHVIDSDQIGTFLIKAALAMPAGLVVQNWYTDNDVWGIRFRHNDRPLATSLALFRASRGQLVEILAALPDSWSLTIRVADAPGAEPRVRTVEDLFDVQVRHALEHVEEIRALHEALEARHRKAEGVTD
jgi:catechol 2,3-dioxygenase-like lactoylglutathione lyase family enzyme